MFGAAKGTTHLQLQRETKTPNDAFSFPEMIRDLVPDSPTASENLPLCKSRLTPKHLWRNEQQSSRSDNGVGRKTHLRRSPNKYPTVRRCLAPNEARLVGPVAKVSNSPTASKTPTSKLQFPTPRSKRYWLRKTTSTRQKSRWKNGWPPSDYQNILLPWYKASGTLLIAPSFLH